MNAPLVSVIMPAYNAEAFIAEAIQSVCDQTHKNWELLVVINGCKDNTEAVVDTFNDPRIRKFETPDAIGVSAARNIALTNMQGEYFAFLDADDLLPKKSLTSRLEVFQNKADLHYVDGTVEEKNASLATTLRTYHPSFRGNPISEYIRLTGNCFYGVSAMVKRQRAVNYQFRTSMSHAEDLLFFLEHIGPGLYDYTSSTVMITRRHQDSAMQNLRGLEQGYRELYHTVNISNLGSEADRAAMKQRIIRIMTRSYLKSGQALQALRFRLNSNLA